MCVYMYVFSTYTHIFMYKKHVPIYSFSVILFSLQKKFPKIKLQVIPRPGPIFLQVSLANAYDKIYRLRNLEQSSPYMR